MIINKEDVDFKRKQFNDYLDESNKFINGIEINVESIRVKFALSSFQLCQEHARSILKLIEQEFVASALTLLRPQIDALLRGWWLHTSVDDEYFKNEVLEKSKFPDVRKNKLIELILETLDDSGRAMFGPHLARCQNIYNDFAHGGYEQIARRLRDPNLIAYTQTNNEVYKCMADSMLYDGLSKLQSLELLSLNDEANYFIDLMARYKPKYSLDNI